MVRDGRQEEERGEIGETNAAKESCAQSEFVCYTMFCISAMDMEHEKRRPQMMMPKKKMNPM